MARPFRLQTVARLREAHRDAARAQLADALRAAEVLHERRAEVAARYRTLLEQRRAAMSDPAAGAAWLLSAGRYELVLRGDEKTLDDNLATVEKEIERRRQLLAEADREVRAIEVLRERAEERERAESNRREAKRLDEHGSRVAYASTHDQPLSL